MKTLGMIGGSTWVSTIDYYRAINSMINEKLGGIHSARLFMYSIDMDDMFQLAMKEGWPKAGEFLTGIAKKIEAGGAEALVICANTPHIEAKQIQAAIDIPLINIVDETAKEIKRLGLKKVALLGTKVTMENGFYQDILSQHGIESVTPDLEDRDFIQHSIFTELGKEIILPETKQRYLNIIEKLRRQGAEGVILGCTEIPLVVKQEDCTIPALDTTMIHVKAAVDWMMGE